MSDPRLTPVDREDLQLTLDIDPEQVPANSQASKQKREEGTAPDPVRAQPQKREIKTVTKKKSFWSRFKEAVIGDDVKSLPDYLFFEVILPKSMRVFRDSADAAMDKVFKIGGSSGSRRNIDSRGHVVPYGSAFDDNRPSSRPRRQRIDFTEYGFNSKDDAMYVLDNMKALVNDYNVCTVNQAFDLMNMPTKPINENWGWTSLRGAGLYLSDGLYYLDIPPCKYLD